MAKINVYQIVNAPKISSAAPPEIKSVGAALNANTRSINSLGKSFSSIAALSGGLRNVAVASLKESKLKEVQERRAKQREEDRKREEDFENRKSLVPDKAVAKQKKPGGKEKSWLEKTFGGLFGWLAPLAKGALALFGFILASQAYKDIKRMLSDPQTRARIESFFEKLKFVWDKIFKFGTWLVRDNLLAGFENVFGKDKTAVERIKGVGQILIGIIGLKALFNPFGLMADIMGLMQTRGRELRKAQNQVRKQNRLIDDLYKDNDFLDAENKRLREENRRLKQQKGKGQKGRSGEGTKGTSQAASTAQKATRTATGYRNTLQGQIKTFDKVAKSKRFILRQKLRISLKNLRRGVTQRGITSMPRIDPKKAYGYRGSTVPFRSRGAVQATRGSQKFVNGRLFRTEVKQFNIVKTRMGVFKQRLRIFGGKAARFAKLGPTSGVRKFFTSWANISAPLIRGMAKIAKFTPRAIATIAKISFKGASTLVKGTSAVVQGGAKVLTTTARVAGAGLKGIGAGIKLAFKALNRIPIIGTLLEFLFNLLDFSTFEETGNFKDIKFDLSRNNVRNAGYRALGAAIGGAVGSFVFPPIGTILGMQVGSYAGDIAYELFEKGTPPEKVGEKVMGDLGKLWEGIVAGGGAALSWAKQGMARLYELFPKIRLAEHLPDWLLFKDWLLTTEPFRSILDAQLPDLGRMAQNIGSGLASGANAFMNFASQIGTAFFSDKPITPGDKRPPTEHKKPDEEVDQARLITKNYGFTKGKRVWFKIDSQPGVDYKAVKEEEGWSFYKRTNEGLINLTGYQGVDTKNGANPWVIAGFEKAMGSGNYTLRAPTERRTLEERADVNIENLGGAMPGLAAEAERMDRAAQAGRTMPAAKLLEMGYTQAVVDAVNDPLNPKMELGAQFRKNFGKKRGESYYFKTTGGTKYEAKKTGQGFEFFVHKEGFLGLGFGFGAGVRIKTPIGEQKGFINEFVTKISTNPKGEDSKRTKASAISTEPSITPSDLTPAAETTPEVLAPVTAAVDAHPLYQRIGISPADWEAYRSSVAQIESSGNYSIYGGSGNLYDGRYQLGKMAKADASRIAGIANPGHSDDPNDPARIAFRKNPALQEQLFSAYTVANHGYLSNVPEYAALSPKKRLEVLGYAHNQGWANAADWLRTGKANSKDGFGTKGTRFANLIRARLGGAPTEPRQSEQRTPTRTATLPKGVSLTSNYGVMRGNKMHGGTDIGAPAGTPLVAITDATIVDYGSLQETGAKRGDPNGWGNFVVYKDAKGTYHLYGHILDGFKKSGQVKAGEQIAAVGSTGKSSGPHLHWEIGSGWTGGVLTGKRDPLSSYKVSDPFIGQTKADLGDPTKTPQLSTGQPTTGSSLLDGLLLLPQSAAGNAPPVPLNRVPEIVKLLESGTLRAYQKGADGTDLMAAIGGVLNQTGMAMRSGINAAGELFRRAAGALQGGGTPGDGTTSPSSDPTQISGDNPYGLQSQVDKYGNPIGFSEFARSQAPMDTPLTDTYNTLHKQWEAVLGIDPDGDGYKPRDVDRSDIFRNDYGGRTLSVEQGLGILFKRLGDENKARKGTTGIGPIADGDVYGSLIPSYSTGGKITPMPNNLEGFFFGKVFKSIGKAISGAFNAVKNAVTSITSNPIFKVVTTAVSIFVPALAPVIAGINAVSSLMQGDILGAVVGGVGALGGMFPGTFGTEAGTFWSGLNKTFGEGLGGVMKGFLTGGIGGAIGSIGGMLPEGMKAFFSGMGSFMDKNPMVKNILSAGIANIPGLGSLLGPALEGAGLSPTAAIDQQAQGAGTLISSLLNVGLGLVGKAMGLEQAAISVGALPAAFGMPPAASAMMDPKNEALRQMSQMGPIEVVHVPVIIEKLVAIREPVPIVTTRVIQKPAPQKTA